MVRPEKDLIDSAGHQTLFYPECVRRDDNPGGAGHNVAMSKRFRQGEHICSFHDGEEEQLAIAVEYLADGLRLGERCFYVAQSADALSRFRHALTRAGIDVDDSLERGALELATHAQAHLEDGGFDGERMIRLLNEAVERALAAGFNGLRTCGDMSWLLSDPPGADQVVAYEAFLTEFFHGLPAAGMCQYDRRRLPADILDHALATHSSVLHHGRHVVNPFLQPKAVAVSRAPQPRDVEWKIDRLRGW